ncbi:MAG: hypothetical protein NTV01_07560 [Bacteroidia bacterium]|nr:hypothetical protein [Bacteroidia bacterium]
MNGLALKLALIILMLPIALAGQNKYFPPDPYTQSDGVTHWSKYQITSPGFLGPNALPVPFIHKGVIPEKFYWAGLYEYYYARGDKTHDFKTHLIIPVAKGRIGLECKYVPVEFFTMDSAVSRTRRTLSGTAVRGKAFGDIYFGTIIQLIKNHTFLPDFAVAMSCRTASGTGRENARYTDTPGYYLDGSIGDSYGINNSFFRHFRWYAELGFYVWQTYIDNYPQNDALLFGGGIDFDFRDFFVNQTLCGYSGYMHNGDHPVVYRIDLGIKIGFAAMVFGYEKGLRDYPFQSIRAGFEITGLTD